MVRRLTCRAVWGGEWTVVGGRHRYGGVSLKNTMFKMNSSITVDELKKNVSNRMGTDHPPNKNLILSYIFAYPDADMCHPNVVNTDLDLKDVFDISDKGSTVTMYVTFEDMVGAPNVEIPNEHDFPRVHQEDFFEGVAILDNDTGAPTEDNDQSLVVVETTSPVVVQNEPDEAYLEDYDNPFNEQNQDLENSRILATVQIDPNNSSQHGGASSSQGRDDGIKLDYKGLYTADELMFPIRKAAGINKWTFVVKKRDSTRIVLRCIQWETCDWMLGAYKKKDATHYKIKKWKRMHKCTASCVDVKHHNINCNVLARELVGQMHDPKNKPSIEEVQRIAKTYGSQSDYWNSWFVLEKARNLVQGTREESYADLPAFMWQCQQMNPETIWDILVDPETNIFKYCFLAIGVQHRGIPLMRPILAIDMAHMKSEPLCLVVATMMDSQQHCYPIAWGLVENECNDSWNWFLSHLQVILPDRKLLTFVSDRNNALINGVKNVYPLANHVHCYHHLEQNAHHHYKTPWGEYFYRAAYTFSKDKCEALLLDMAIQCPDVNNVNKKTVEQYFREAGLEKWARSYSLTPRFEMMTSNHAESLNACLDEARRAKPTRMFSIICSHQAAWRIERLEEVDKMGAPDLTTLRETTMMENVTLAIGMEVEVIENTVFQVFPANELRSYIVDFDVEGEIGTCTCGEFQQMWFPCVHACACAKLLRKHLKLNVQYDFQVMYKYTSAFYARQTMRDAWTGAIYTPPHRSSWVMNEIPLHIRQFRPAPPVKVTVPGRKSSNNRHKSFMETMFKKREPYGCRLCKKKGHTKRSCPLANKTT